MVQTETRQHLLDGMSNPFVDTHTRDSAHRSVEFERDSGASTSTRVFDGAGKMIEFGDEAAAVEVDVDDSMSQYVDLDPNGMPTKPRVYDDMGNLIDDESTLLYYYDAFGRLVQVWDEVGPTLEAVHLYDAHDRRVLTVAGGNYLQFAYAGDGNVIEERLFTSGVPWRQYMRDGMDGKVLRMRTTTFEEDLKLDGLSQIDIYHFCQHNSRGDVGALTGSRGGVIEYQTYSWLGRMDVLDEFGAPVVPNLSTVGSPWGLGGMRIATETAWWSGGHRFVDPRVGELASAIASCGAGDDFAIDEAAGLRSPYWPDPWSNKWGRQWHGGNNVDGANEVTGGAFSTSTPVVATSLQCPATVTVEPIVNTNPFPSNNGYGWVIQFTVPDKPAIGNPPSLIGGLCLLGTRTPCQMDMFFRLDLEEGHAQPRPGPGNRWHERSPQNPKGTAATGRAVSWRASTSGTGPQPSLAGGNPYDKSEFGIRLKAVTPCGGPDVVFTISASSGMEPYQVTLKVTLKCGDCK